MDAIWAIRKMEQYFEGALKNSEVAEAWQTLKSAVEIDTSTNIQSMQCSHEFFVRNNGTVKCKKCGGVYDTYE